MQISDTTSFVAASRDVTIIVHVQQIPGVKQLPNSTCLHGEGCLTTPITMEVFEVPPRGRHSDVLISNDLRVCPMVPQIRYIFLGCISASVQQHSIGHLSLPFVVTSARSGGMNHAVMQ